MSAPALPALAVMQCWLHIGWALVLAGGAAGLLARLPVPRWVRLSVPAVLGLWALWPGELSAAYGLGLAFQAPSGVLALLSAWWGWTALRKSPPAGVTAHGTRAFRGETALVPAGIVGGWVLLLDTFAQLPWSVYPLGFGPAALAVVLAMALAPLLQAGAMRRGTAWVVPAALLLFAVFRLPSGNLWDAVLDPWLWLVLHIVAVRGWVRRKGA